MTLSEKVKNIMDENPNITTNELIYWYLEKHVCNNFIESFFLKLILKRCDINLFSLEITKTRLLRKK